MKDKILDFVFKHDKYIKYAIGIGAFVFWVADPYLVKENLFVVRAFGSMIIGACIGTVIYVGSSGGYVKGYEDAAQLYLKEFQKLMDDLDKELVKRMSGKKPKKDKKKDKVVN